MSLVLFLLLGVVTAFPPNLTCKESHYPPEFYAKYYPVASAVSGYVWNVSCKEYNDTTGNLDWVKTNGGFRAIMMSSFAHGGIFTVFNIVNDGHIVFTTNITLYAVTDDPMYSPLELCVWQTQEEYSQETYYVPIVESGANLYNDVYVQRGKQQGAPAFYAKNTEYFAVSKNGKFMSNQLLRINPKTGKGEYMLACVYDAIDTYPKQVGDWWSTSKRDVETNLQEVTEINESTALNFAKERYGYEYRPIVDEELVSVGKFNIPKSLVAK